MLGRNDSLFSNYSKTLLKENVFTISMYCLRVIKNTRAKKYFICCFIAPFSGKVQLKEYLLCLDT